MWVAFHLERAMSGTPFVRVLALAAMVSLCGFAAAETPAAAADKITSLPGLTSPLPFNMYSGYVTVNASHGRALFYWFVESANNPSTDPVLVWMQGGPGCSSLFGCVSTCLCANHTAFICLTQGTDFPGGCLLVACAG